LENNDVTQIAVTLSVMEPEYLYEGNEPFPDWSWIDITKKDIVIPPGTTVEVPIHITIPEQYFPDDSEISVSNYNHSYEAWFFADQYEGGGNIQTDYRCRWSFITPMRYVPAWERPEFQTFTLPIIILIIIGIIVIILVIIWKRRIPTHKRGKTKRKTEEDDIFT
jgi:hypothetical protein